MNVLAKYCILRHILHCRAPHHHTTLSRTLPQRQLWTESRWTGYGLVSPTRLMNLAPISLVYGQEKNKQDTNGCQKCQMSCRKKKKSNKNKGQKKQPVEVDSMIWNSVLFKYWWIEGICIHSVHACSETCNHLIMHGDYDRSFALRIPFLDIYRVVFARGLLYLLLWHALGFF